jgi:hypothetical protein
MPNTKRLIVSLCLMVMLPAFAAAQTFTMNSTTLSAAMTATAKTATLTSTSAATGSTFGAVTAGQAVFIDGEFMPITGLSGSVATVQRRANPTAHSSGAVVWIATPNSFMHRDPPIGNCTLANQGDPWINVENNRVWRCSGSSTASGWMNVVDEYVFLPASACNSSVSGNSTGTNGLTVLGSAPSLPAVQAATSASGTNTHYFTCSLSNPPGRLDLSRGSYVVDVQFYYGVQTTAIGTQVAVLASGTMNAKTVFTKIAYPAAGASETATGLVEATRADSGTLVITPVVASFNTATTTAGEFYTATFAPATPIPVGADRTQLLFTASLLNTATSATVTNSPGLLVHYRRLSGM